MNDMFYSKAEDDGLVTIWNRLYWVQGGRSNEFEFVVLKPVDDLLVGAEDDGSWRDNFHLFSVCVEGVQVQSESKLFWVGQDLREYVLAFIGRLQL